MSMLTDDTLRDAIGQALHIKLIDLIESGLDLNDLDWYDARNIEDLTDSVMDAIASCHPTSRRTQ